MKNVFSKVSTLLALCSAAALPSANADVSGEVTAIDAVTGAITVTFDAAETVLAGEPVVAFKDEKGKTVVLGRGEVLEVQGNTFLALFDSKDVAIGAKTLVKQVAPEHDADLISAIPDDVNAVSKPIVDSALDAPNAIKACRIAIAEFPKEARFYAQLGRALEVDGKPASAILQYEKALELRAEYPWVLHSLGKLRFYGPEELRDFTVARRYFNKAAELGFDASMPVIGTMCRDGLGGDRDYAKAAAWFAIAAEKGNPFSQNALAECFENGWGIDKEMSKALLWYRSSAELGYVPAFRNLGRVFATGIGVEANAKRAFDWYSRAAEKDDTEAQYHVGLAFLKGNGVVFSSEYALEWLTRAADAGHSLAMREIANHYYSNGDVKGDLDLAAAWFKKAAQKGDISAQFNLGQMAESGKGLEKNRDSAISWYRQAARQGHSEAQKRLAKLKVDW